MSSMIGNSNRHNSRGGVNLLLIPLILLVLFFLGSAAFGYWAYTGRQDYKLNSDKKVAAAVEIAKQNESIVKDKQHAETDKSPLRDYVGPAPFGGVHVSYPKTWSAYVNDSVGGNQPLDGYFHPSVVPSLTDQSSIFALRIQVINQAYTTVLTSLNQLTASKQPTTAVPFSFSKVPTTVGVRFDGAIVQNKKITGSMILVPLRDKTLKVWTESPTYLADFNTYILPNISFAP